MSSIKPGASRALRSKAIAQTQQVLSGVSRGIAATTKNATLVQSAGRPQSSTPFNLQDIYRPLPHQFTPQSHTSLPSSDQSSFSGLLNAITHTLSTTPPNGRSPLPYLHTLLRSYASDPGHWSQYAHANPDKQYTRNLVCEVPGVFNLLLLVWTPGKASPVHDHADAHCLMKVLKGEIRETRFATPERSGEQGPLVETSNLRFGLDKVSYMADQLGLHAIANPHLTEYAVSLHLYFPPNAAMRGCHVYDTSNGESRHVTQCTYDSVAGKVPMSTQ